VRIFPAPFLLTESEQLREQYLPQYERFVFRFGRKSCPHFTQGFNGMGLGWHCRFSFVAHLIEQHMSGLCGSRVKVMLQTGQVRKSRLRWASSRQARLQYLAVRCLFLN
jgi:hypothetical protein